MTTTFEGELDKDGTIQWRQRPTFESNAKKWFEADTNRIAFVALLLVSMLIATLIVAGHYIYLHINLLQEFKTEQINNSWRLNPDYLTDAVIRKLQNV